MKGTFQKMKKLKLADFKKTRGKSLVLAMLLLATVPVFASGGGAGAFATANTEVKKYWTPLKTIIQTIGAIVGIIGGLRIYNKWQNGDQDVNKELLGWSGACLFLTVAPTFVGAFFGLT